VARLLLNAAPTSPRLAQSLCGGSLCHLGNICAVSTQRTSVADRQSLPLGTPGQLPRIASHNGYRCCHVSRLSGHSIGSLPRVHLLGVFSNPYSMWRSQKCLWMPSVHHIAVSTLALSCGLKVARQSLAKCPKRVIRASAGVDGGGRVYLAEFYAWRCCPFADGHISTMSPDGEL